MEFFIGILAVSETLWNECRLTISLSAESASEFTAAPGAARSATSSIRLSARPSAAV
jgi:hypothetical protein